MASSSSSEPSTETPINSETRRLASCFLLSAANYQTPSMQPLFRPVFRHGLAMQELFHKSVASTVDQCVRALEGFVSGNPLLRRVLSLSSEFQSVCRQIHCRNSVSASLLSNHNFAAVLPGDSVAGLVVANGINNFLNIYNTLLVVRLVLTWFPNAPPVIVSPLSTLCDPYLNIFRGIIPPLGGSLDLSPILAFLVLNAFTSTAAALPAELPQNVASQENTKSGTSFTDLTTSQEKWLKRLSAQKSKSSSSSF